MLTVTESAARFIAEGRTEQGIPDDALLRIAATGSAGDELHLGFVDQPFDGDQVSDAHGLRYCVADDVAPSLDDAMLDLEQVNGEPALVLVPIG